MFRAWSISSLLKLWAFATIFAIIVISSVAIYTNNIFSSSQSNLTEKVLPIENASRQINAVASSFITRQKQVIASRSVESISDLTPRDQLENEFSIQWHQIRTSVSTEDDQQIVNLLNQHYLEFLLVDSELLDLITEQHHIRSKLNLKTRRVTELQENIQHHVEAISGRIKLQHVLAKRRAVQTPSQAITVVNIERVMKQRELIQKLSQSVRLSVLHISSLTQKLMLSDDSDMLLSIRDNSIKQYQTILRSDISQLKDNLKNKQDLLASIELLEKEQALLMDTVINDESAIYNLRLKQLEINGLLENGQQKSIAILQQITTQLDRLASIVRAKSLQTVKDSIRVVHQAQWLIIALTICITLGMVLFILSISQRINKSLKELSSAMHALSSGLFDTRLNVVQGRSEFAIIAVDFNSFAENTQALIKDLADAKEALQVRKEYLTTVLNAVPEAILTLSSEGVITTSNPVAEKVLKANDETLKGLSINDFLAEQYSDVPFKQISTMLAENRELDGRDYNNQPFSMWLSLNHVSSLKHDIWVCVISDITAWKQADKKLQTTSSELDAILENAMVGIALIKNRTILRVNSKFEQLFVRDRTEVEGQSTRLLYPNDETYEQMGDDAYSALSDGGSYVGEIRLEKKGGELFWAMMSGKSINPADPSDGSIWLFEDITIQRENDEKLRRLASLDTLTGLPNRGVFNDRLDHAIHKAHRNTTRLAVFFLDLDRFKQVNDSLGHKAGDQLLCEVATRLKTCIREGDTVARLGGDEFTVILEDVSSARHVGGVANKVLHTIAEPYLIDGTEVSISPSIGISLYPADGRDVELLVKNADAAMYHAKNSGRNNFQFYSGEMNAQSAKRLAMETSLRRAIDNHEFYLHFQPQIDIETGAITGAEALLRWNSDKWGDVSPADFIPILEDAGLISNVGQTVIEQAVQAYLSLKDKLVPEFRMAVNLSGRQFQGGHLAIFIEDTLAATGMSPDNLELEITESVLMDDTELAITTLNSLSNVGITLAIDDFGTGYSSLSYLKRFPLNVLKIDRSFIRDVNIDEDDAAIVKAILAMSHRLNLEVIAEGVETSEQLQFLEENDCDRVQGYYFSKPLSLEDFSRFIDENSVL